jgi:hypothetical protein
MELKDIIFTDDRFNCYGAYIGVVRLASLRWESDGSYTITMALPGIRQYKMRDASLEQAKCMVKTMFKQWLKYMTK